ncbi:MAG: DUF2852 domain-containing protein, partial [Anderseniella sp.]
LLISYLKPEGFTHMTTITRRKSRWTPLGVAAVVLGFVTWWPIGLAVVAYIMWGGSVDELASDAVDQIKASFKSTNTMRSGSGNAAFDDYRKETLRRLEEEQAEFNGFMSKLREARDREEFERFMADRNQSIASPKVADKV